tara:strand:+ start:135 stop:455 length:321 start_codon:yes stop_codon:yes gene_type:complete
MKNRFLISNSGDIQKIYEANPSKVKIDTAKGKDVAAPKSASVPPVEKAWEFEDEFPGKTITARVERSKKLVNMASATVSNIMSNVRSGKEIDIETAKQHDRRSTNS